MKAKTCKDNDGSAVCDLMLSIVNCCFKSDHYHCAVLVCAKDDTLVVHDCFVLKSIHSDRSKRATGGSNSPTALLCSYGLAHSRKSDK